MARSGHFQPPFQNGPRVGRARRAVSLQFSPLDGLSAAQEEAIMKTIVSVMTAAAILTSAPRVVQAQSHNHVIQTPQEAQWGPAPPMLPAGAQIAVLAGDPTKSVPYAVRLKFPASYAIPAHSHPTDEHVTVLSGACRSAWATR